MGGSGDCESGTMDELAVGEKRWCGLRRATRSARVQWRSFRREEDQQCSQVSPVELLALALPARGHVGRGRRRGVPADGARSRASRAAGGRVRSRAVPVAIWAAWPSASGETREGEAERPLPNRRRPSLALLRSLARSRCTRPSLRARSRQPRSHPAHPHHRPHPCRPRRRPSPSRASRPPTTTTKSPSRSSSLSATRPARAATAQRSRANAPARSRAARTGASPFSLPLPRPQRPAHSRPLAQQLLGSHPQRQLVQAPPRPRLAQERRLPLQTRPRAHLLPAVHDPPRPAPLQALAQPAPGPPALCRLCPHGRARGPGRLGTLAVGVLIGGGGLGVGRSRTGRERRRRHARRAARRRQEAGQGQGQGGAAGCGRRLGRPRTRR